MSEDPKMSEKERKGGGKRRKKTKSGGETFDDLRTTNIACITTAMKGNGLT